ncbi:Alcohol dehydrogenase superfamily zinc-containing [Macrophomina phaseolina MS6]|uniref:Alcohol dehydrogenase superfamily zinc-containing n=1 Tax=Macrophomina phaseolina (strain MS6) TaxID=1126212 RepID=K2S192_MACPH|nr:Alcohol dehydrogenase superfamily zinc-containing [Macrophomina phaseolina MS6]
MTAAVGLFLQLHLPPPWKPPRQAAPSPLVIYGACSPVGAYAIQLTRRSNIHPLICVAGRSQSFVESLIERSKGDVAFEYRKGNLIEAIIKALPTGVPLLHVFEAISAEGPDADLQRVLAPRGTMALIQPASDKEYLRLRQDVFLVRINV